MRRRHPTAGGVVLIIVAGVVLAIAAIVIGRAAQGADPDPDICRDALRQQYVAARTGAPYRQGLPASCEGFNQAELYTLLSEAVAQAEGGR